MQHDHSHAPSHSHGHAHAHSHSHGHGHGGHSHAPAKFGRAFAIGVSLNIVFVVAEFAYGKRAGSLALVADAGHNLSDVLGLILAWGALRLGTAKPSARFTYGLGSSSILAALVNAVLLLVAVGAIAWEACQRVLSPAPIATGTVIVVASIGIVINFSTALLFMSGRKHDLNIRGAYLHMMADAAVSLGVVLAALLMRATGYPWIDPIVSLLICVVIVWGTWSLLRDSLQLMLKAVPPHIDGARVENFLRTRPAVTGLHDLHIWGMSTTENALTVHLIMPQGHPGDAYLRQLAHDLDHEFGISHATFQIELGNEAHACALASSDVV